MIDKNKAVIDYLLTCPDIQGSPLYFNFIEAKDNSNQFITNANDTIINQPYIDGSVEKVYTFTLIAFKSISYNPVTQVEGYTDENVADMADVQKLIDWVTSQNKIRNYPNFGGNCVVDNIKANSNNPNLDSVDTTLTPALAKYSISIEIEYLDITDRLWNKEEE